jgi:hypothetical protein
MAMVTLQDVYRLTNWWTESTVPNLIYRDVGGCIHAKLVFLAAESKAFCRVSGSVTKIYYCRAILARV